jgi:hypothetical protein
MQFLASCLRDYSTPVLPRFLLILFSCLDPLEARVYTQKKERENRSCCSVCVKCLYVARLILLILFE